MEQKPTKTPSSDANNAGSERQIIINAQYVKDLSFENPGAPLSLVSPKGKPNIDLSVDIKAQALQGNSFEVVLQITAKATAEDDKPLFIADLAYGGVFTLNGIEDKDREAVLLVYCPNMLFPFARRVIADATRDGGFPPLMVDPIDFFALYSSNKQDNAKQEKEDA